VESQVVILKDYPIIKLPNYQIHRSYGLAKIFQSSTISGFPLRTTVV